MATSEKKISEDNPEDNEVFYVDAVVRKIHNRFSTYLNVNTKHFSKKQKWVLLLSFSFLFGAISFFVFVDALEQSAKKTNSLKPASIRMPAHWDKNGTEFAQPNYEPTAWETHQLIRFQRYMDSLQQYNPRKRDSIIKARPGLIDTVEALNKLYRQKLRKDSASNF